jgi:hypothetical protein
MSYPGQTRRCVTKPHERRYPLRVDPIFLKRKFTLEPNRCFVLMPFKADLQPVYSDHIKKVVEDQHLMCQRGDDIFSNSAIIEDIWESINRARIIIADLTGKNPNVFYEVGIAHVLGKQVVLITQSIDDIPFDLRHLRNIIYEYTPRGMTQFEANLKNTVQLLLSQPVLSIEQFKRDLVDDSFPNTEALTVYSNEFVLDFVLDRLNEVFFRKKGLELCFARGFTDQKFLDTVYREQNDELMRNIAKLIKKYATPVSKTMLLALLEGKRNVALAAVGAAYSLAANGHYSSGILHYANNHSSWEVQHRAVNRIIDLDDQDSLDTLIEFQELEYHLSVNNIRKFIEGLDSDGRLMGEQRFSAISFLTYYLHDDKFSEQMKESLRQTIDLLENHDLV